MTRHKTCNISCAEPLTGIHLAPTRRKRLDTDALDPGGFGGPWVLPDCQPNATRVRDPAADATSGNPITSALRAPGNAYRKVAAAVRERPHTAAALHHRHRLQTHDTDACPQPRTHPLCDIPSGCGSFTGPWTVTRSSLRMLRRVAAFCRPLRPVLPLVSFPRSRSPVVGVLGLC